MKGMKIVFGLVVISVMAMSLGSANAALFETDFESYSGGPVAGQDGWAGWNGPNAYIDDSTNPDSYMRGYQWLGVSAVGRNTQAVYRPFAAQTGQVRMEALYSGGSSESSWRSISLRDGSSDNAAIAALVGTSKHYGEGTPEDPREPLWFAYNDEGRVWDYTVLGFVKEDVYKIVIDANVATQTYDAMVYAYDISTGVTGALTVSWTGLSFGNTVTEISRVYVQSWDSGSRWDNFNITPEPATLAVLALGGLAALLRRKR